MRERRVASEHAAGMGVHHASAHRVIDLKTDFIKSLQQKSCPLKSFPIVSSADRGGRKWRWAGPFEACNAYLAQTMTTKKDQPERAKPRRLVKVAGGEAANTPAKGAG
jgi:hypothetical protein